MLHDLELDIGQYVDVLGRALKSIALQATCSSVGTQQHMPVFALLPVMLHKLMWNGLCMHCSTGMKGYPRLGKPEVQCSHERSCILQMWIVLCLRG